MALFKVRPKFGAFHVTLLAVLIHFTLLWEKHWNKYQLRKRETFYISFSTLQCLKYLMCIVYTEEVSRQQQQTNKNRWGSVDLGTSLAHSKYWYSVHVNLLRNIHFHIFPLLQSSKWLGLGMY